MSSFKDAKFINAEHSVIDMVHDHPVHGWVPITINEAEYPTVWAEVVATSPEAFVVDPDAETKRRAIWRDKVEISRSAFCRALYAKNLLTLTEAVEAGMGHWPATILGPVASAPADALILWASVSTVKRNHPLILNAAMGAGLTDETVDELFGYPPLN